MTIEREFIEMKQRLIDRLADGQADRKVWEFVIAVGEMLELYSSVYQLRAYYNQYNIDKLV